jgi:hypothetical protein
MKRVSFHRLEGKKGVTKDRLTTLGVALVKKVCLSERWSKA